MLVIPLCGRKMCSELYTNLYRAVLVFDTANQKAGKLMLKTWLKYAEIKHIGAYFAVSDAKSELSEWDKRLTVTSLGYNNL